MKRSEAFVRLRKVCVIGVLLIVIQQSCSQTEIPIPDCISGPSTRYNGTHNYTVSGITCQRWDRTEPHNPKHTPSDGGAHNFCRNPDGDLKGTWCYTTNSSVRWEYCEIPKCADDSRVVWTNYDSQSESSHILAVYADPEIVKKATDHSGIFNVSVLVLSNRTLTEFWAITGNYDRQILFYTDYRSEYIGIRHLQHNVTLKMYQGMAHGIESMAYDWVSRNLYWTDSEFKWVMASENTFQYYAPVYRTGGDPPYALAIHTKQRKLYFSTYKALKSKIIVTDMAGQNAQVLFRFPQVFDVTGLTIDYTEDRLYWTDFTGYGGMVVSSNTDGTNKTQHHYRGGSIFWGIAAYLDYLYVTDVHARYSQNADKFYSVWVITKQTNNVFRYTLNGKPRGITVLSESEDQSQVPSIGECSGQRACDQICLPRINATRECACSLGYHKVGEVGCEPRNYQDNYLLIADAGQGRLFQVPFNYANSSHYSIVRGPSASAKATTVAVDMAADYVYWSDKTYSSIKRALIDGSRKTTLATSRHASSIQVDPRTGNVFFFDADYQYIYIMSNTGNYVKAIMKSNLTAAVNTSIQMIAQDSLNRKIYWTDTQRQEGRGQVWRMNLDGSGKEIVFDNMNWPRAITVDHQRRSLFVGEAKSAMIYEVPLSQLQTITNTSLQNIPNQYDLSGHIRRLSFHILDIKVYNNIVYFMDGKNNKLEKFNITEGPASLASFGPSEFFSVTSIALYSTAYHQAILSSIPSPCLSRRPSCNHICVDVSDTLTQCLCSDGYVNPGTGSVCFEGPRENNPPNYGNTCPGNQRMQISQCSSYVIPNWEVPTWTDDNTATTDLNITAPPLNMQLTEGPHTIYYTARDSEGLVGTCSFTVTVVATSCGLPPSLPSYINRITPFLCGNQFGSMYAVSCRNPNQYMYFGGEQYRNLTNICGETGNWLFTDFQAMTCRDYPTTTTTTTTTPSITTTTPTTTPSTETTPSITTTGASNNAGPGTTLLTAQSGTLNNNNQAVPKSESSTGLKSGPLAAICVLVILLVIIIIAVTIVTIRNRPVWKITRLQWPVFWKRKEEEEVDMTPPRRTPPTR